METVITFDTAVFSFIAAIIIPMLVGVVTTKLATSQVKSAVLLVLSVLASYITVLLGQDEWTWRAMLTAFGEVLIASGVLHTNVLKPLKVTSSIQTATENFGLGPKYDKEVA